MQCLCCQDVACEQIVICEGVGGALLHICAGQLLHNLEVTQNVSPTACEHMPCAKRSCHAGVGAKAINE